MHTSHNVAGTGVVAGPFAKDAVLLAVFGSAVIDDTVAVFVEPW